MATSTIRLSEGAARDDRIPPVTRIVLVIVVPFLVLALVIWFPLPERTGERLAWAIKPPLTAYLLAEWFAPPAFRD